MTEHFFLVNDVGIPPVKDGAFCRFCHIGNEFSAPVAVGQTGNLFIQLLKAVGIVSPGEDGSIDHARKGKVRLIDVAAVTPVCVQNTFRMVFSRIAAHPCDIFVPVLHQVHPLVPAADPRTEILSCTSFRHHFCLMLSLLGCIAPGQADGFLWQLFDQLRWKSGLGEGLEWFGHFQAHHLPVSGHGILAAALFTQFSIIAQRLLHRCDLL